MYGRVVMTDNQELFRLAVVTILLSRQTVQEHLESLHFKIIHCYDEDGCYHFDCPCYSNCFIHALRIFLIEPDWQPNIIQLISEGFIGEAYWGYYGVKQIQLSGNIFYVGIISEPLYPILGFLQYLYFEPNVLSIQLLCSYKCKSNTWRAPLPHVWICYPLQFVTLGPTIEPISICLFVLNTFRFRLYFCKDRGFAIGYLFFLQ